MEGAALPPGHSGSFSAESAVWLQTCCPWGPIRSENWPLLPLFLSPQEPDLGKDGRMEWVLESGPLAGVPEVTLKFTSQVQTANTQASSDEKLSWKLAQTKAMPHT